jgi:hypothetical protein
MKNESKNRVEALKALHDIELVNYFSASALLLAAFSKERIDCIKRYLDKTSSEGLEKDIAAYMRKLGGYDKLRKLQEELMRGLNSTEINDLVQYVLEIWQTQRHEDEYFHYTKMLSRIFCIHPDKFPPIQTRMLALGIINAFVEPIYLTAHHELSLAMQKKLNSLSAADYSLVTCFAWGKDSLVEEQFQAWDANPPKWWSNPDRKLKDATLSAGWELSPEGKRRYLYHETCYQLVPTTGEKPKMEREDNCQWCEQKLVNFLDLDLTDARLAFLGLEGSRLVIAFCSWCHAFQEQYFELDFEGNAKWSHYNRPEPPFRLDYNEGEMPNILVLADKSRGAFESLSLEYEQNNLSQVGGFPAWVNREMFPTCPACKRHMMFIGQVKWLETAEDHVEGNSYAFLCSDCKISLVNYDQT